MTRVAILKFVLGVAIVMSLSVKNTFSQKNSRQISEAVVKDKNYCNIIDSIIYLVEGEKIISSDFLVASFIEFAEVSNIKNNINRARLFENDMPYDNYSLGKSIFKIDLLSYMRYFNCHGATNLQQKTQGSFSKADSIMIDNSYSLERLKNENEVFYFMNDSVLIYGNQKLDTIFVNNAVWCIDTTILYR